MSSSRSVVRSRWKRSVTDMMTLVLSGNVRGGFLLSKSCRSPTSESCSKTCPGQNTRSCSVSLVSFESRPLFNSSFHSIEQLIHEGGDALYDRLGFQPSSWSNGSPVLPFRSWLWPGLPLRLSKPWASGSRCHPRCTTWAIISKSKLVIVATKTLVCNGGEPRLPRCCEIWPEACMETW